MTIPDYHVVFPISAANEDRYEVEAWFSDDWQVVEICIEGKDGAVVSPSISQLATATAEILGNAQSPTPKIEIEDELPAERPWLIKDVPRDPVELDQPSLFD